jgi:hypothetical protein
LLVETAITLIPALDRRNAAPATVLQLDMPLLLLQSVVTVILFEFDLKKRSLI